ncbi:MAG TPA: hypothetical protein PLN20_08325, partial [Thermotogota bacterium]|nr:hypothetical protein [Thermotogota bacterium]HOF24378.1 hypothetical protein [Thermotogota bacterium]HOH12306.1 hypothetical protein [Thermotogota bacterium]HOM53996.1 hypothetical protein [Thermotogota bacterium]HOS25612.1 hypothetical protein [Thermotogota bacterium]
ICFSKTENFPVTFLSTGPYSFPYSRYSSLRNLGYLIISPPVCQCFSSFAQIDFRLMRQEKQTAFRRFVYQTVSKRLTLIL